LNSGITQPSSSTTAAYANPLARLAHVVVEEAKTVLEQESL